MKLPSQTQFLRHLARHAHRARLSYETAGMALLQEWFKEHPAAYPPGTQLETKMDDLFASAMEDAVRAAWPEVVTDETTELIRERDRLSRLIQSHAQK